MVRDPALYVIAFSFYAALQPRLRPEQLALCFGGTLIVMTIREMWLLRTDDEPHLISALGSGLLWGSVLFVIGFAWGTLCGYILMWMVQPEVMWPFG